MRYFRKQREEEIGNIAASGLLGFFLEEIASNIYKEAITDVQERMQIHLSDLYVEFHEKNSQAWTKAKHKKALISTQTSSKI